MKDQSIDGKLLFAQNAINNALNNEPIKAALAGFGYDENKLTEGKSLYEKAADLQNKQKKEYGEQFAATDALNLSRAEANKTYLVHLKVARVALKGDRNTEESMQMGGKRKESLSGWLKQVRSFYVNALGQQDTLSKLAKFGITKEKLQGNLTNVEAVETNYNAQLKEKGEAQAATVARDEALDNLQEWMGDFITIARIALESEPQYLEVLGIVEPS